jgi:hypothetical protein
MLRCRPTLSVGCVPAVAVHPHPPLCFPLYVRLFLMCLGLCLHRFLYQQPPLLHSHFFCLRSCVHANVLSTVCIVPVPGLQPSFRVLAVNNE